MLTLFWIYSALQLKEFQEAGMSVAVNYVNLLQGPSSQLSSTAPQLQEAGMSVAVTYQPRTGKTGIKKTVVSDCELSNL